MQLQKLAGIDHSQTSKDHIIYTYITVYCVAGGRIAVVQCMAFLGTCAAMHCCIDID